MKKTLFLFAAGLMLSGVIAAQTGSADIAEAEQLSAQAGRFYTVGKYDEALKLAFRELALREKIGGAEGLGEVNFNIGGIYREKKDYSKSVRHFDAAINYYRQAFGENHKRVLNALNQLFRVLVLKDDKVRGVEVLRSARQVAVSLYGAESAEVADYYFAEAQAYKSMNRRQEAENAYEQAILARDRTLKDGANADRPDENEYMCYLVSESSPRFNEKWSKFDERRSSTRGATFQGSIVNGKAIRLAKPELPPRTSVPIGGGNVLVRVTIDENGDVIAATAICDNSRTLIEASIKAAYASKFSPTLVDGKPVEVHGLIEFKF